MCGIIGGWRAGAGADFAARFAPALGQIAHRGPDDRGQFVTAVGQGTLVLGHTRLSIIDLTPRAHQPMESADGRLLVIFNGEIYNYRELRAELAAGGAVFRSDSDTEVLLAAWQRWNSACLPRLIGMFAFVIYDRTEDTLTAARDAFGIKPLFYSADDDQILFSSELPALQTVRGGTPLLNRQRAYDYLVHGVQDRGDQSFVAGIMHVPPAHLIRMRLAPNGRPAVERWWQPRIGENDIGFAAAADAVRETFLESVRLHLRSDVPVGAALSGGIDSSALVCAVKHVEPEMTLDTFSFIPEEERLSEERWIGIVNAHTGARPHKVMVRPGELARDLPDLIRMQGEPFCTTSMYAQYRVFQAARECGIPVVLEGQGGDEMLAGYDGYPGQRMLSLLERGRFADLHAFASHWPTWPGRGVHSAWYALAAQLLPDALYTHGLAFVGVETEPDWLDLNELRRGGAALRPQRVPRHASGRGRRLVEVLAHAMTDTYLPSLLRYGDRNAMRFSVENRVPFLTIPMAELLLSLPERYLVSAAGETKHVFRAALRGITPDAILDRRDKIGFETPMRSWLAGMAPTIREILRNTTQFEFLHPQKMVKAFETNLAGATLHNALVWRMINLCWWTHLFAVR